MSEPFISEIRIVSFNFAPKGWALCNGQTLPINQNQALFSLIGTFYGGNGVNTFQLPNLQARMPIHQGSANVIGEAGGQSSHTLIASEMPSHVHQAQGVSNAATTPDAAGNTWASSANGPFAGSPNTTMGSGALANVGGSQPHNNMPPSLTLNFIIALQGIFPSRN